MDYSITLLVVSSIAALFIGFLTGMFGVGGGFLMSPILMLIGIAGPVAVGTDVAMIMVNSCLGVFKRRGSGTVDVKLALVLSCGTGLGVLIGTAILESLKGLSPLVILGREQVAVQCILFCMFLLILSFLAIFIALSNNRNRHNEDVHNIGLFGGIKIGAFVYFESLDQPSLSLVPLMLFGVLTGILTGLLGIGGGVLLLPGLIYLVGQRAGKAAGTSLLIILVSSAIATIIHTKNGNISLTLWAVLAAGGLIGTYIGTHVGLKTKDAKLRSYFIYVVIAAALFVAYKVCLMTFGSEGGS